jgi:hypothetical protein
MVGINENMIKRLVKYEKKNYAEENHRFDRN